jgi:dihydrofolate reductase
MGRVTYEAMSAIIQNEAVEGARRMTDLPEVVFSKTLKEPLAWKNSQVANGDLAAEVRSLKEQPGDPLRSIARLMPGGIVRGRTRR